MNFREVLLVYTDAHCSILKDEGQLAEDKLGSTEEAGAISAENSKVTSNGTECSGNSCPCQQWNS